MSCRHRLVPLLLCCVLSLCALGQRRVSWHHSASPYRAVFDLKRSSNHDQGATVIEVPHGGAGDPDGADVHCYDEQGRQLRRSHYGRSSQDRSLILVRPEAGSRQVYAYFGSGSPAPRVPFLPPLVCEVRTLPKGPCRSRAQADKLLAGSKLVGRLPVDRICQVANPLSSDERFAMVFTGCLNMPADGTKILFGAASGPWYLYLDDKPEPVLFREQVAGGYGGSIRGEHRKEIELKKGVHPLRFVVFSTDGDRRFLAALGRCRMKGKEVAAIASEKAQDAADTVKTNVAIAGEQRAIEKNYRAIGEWYVSELKGEAPEAVADIVAAIRASQAKIAELQGEDAPVEAECADVTEAAPEAAPAEAPVEAPAEAPVATAPAEAPTETPVQE